MCDPISFGHALHPSSTVLDDELHAPKIHLLGYTSRSRLRVPCGGMRAQGGNAMNFSRRRFFHLAAGAAALPAMSGLARAQSYPTRTVTIIVPFAAGGP